MPVSNLVHELQRVCDAIDAEWSQAGRSLESFPGIAWRHTDRLDLTPLGQLEACAALLDAPAIAALQQPSSFSDLYLRLYDNGHFWVEVLNWWQSDINVHDHDFSGVQFQLCGEALNIQYAFDTDEECDGIRFGTLRVDSAARWSPGSRSLVVPGRQAPHNVCHLGCPTVSLLIRTHPRTGYGPQWNYFAPGVAASYDVADLCFRKRVKALRLLAQHDESPVFEQAFRHYTTGLDLRQLLFVLMKMIDILFDTHRVHLVHELLASGRPHIADIIEAVSVHRAAEVVKACRWSPTLPAPTRELFALLGSCFDIETASRLAPGLIVPPRSGSIAAAVRHGCRQLPDRDAALLEACLQLFAPDTPISRDKETA
jgi:hypothetical protein